MPIGKEYADILSPEEQKALHTASVVLIDECFQDLQTLQDNQDSFAHTFISIYLPRRYLPRYTPLFLQQFLACIMSVAWKLVQPEHIPLASIAEELAANAIIRRAEVQLEIEHSALAEDAFTGMWDVLFDDLDFEYLFVGNDDGIEESPVGALLGMTSLAFKDWFKPFSDDRIVHPYVEEDEQENN